MAIGFRILKRKRAVSAELVNKYRGIPVANISDSMNRMTAGGPRIMAMHAEGVMCGPALTVKTRPGDNLMVHKALDMAVEGDVIVVDAGGDCTNSIIGEIMLSIAAKKKLGGVVIDGAIRDYGSIKDGTFPVFAAGISHRGPYKDGPGEINVPVAIDGMVIEPGDLVIGDDDGILCVPFDVAAEICTRSAAKLAAETETFRQIADGSLDRSWVDKRLAELGCEIEK